MSKVVDYIFFVMFYYDSFEISKKTNTFAMILVLSKKFFYRAFQMNRVLTIFMMALMFALPLTAQTKRALVIGLGEQADKSWGKIHGDRDVKIVTNRLREAQYKDVTTLVNRQATKDAIVNAMKSLAARCKKGDMVYIHFSGHGQQMTDINGDEDNGWDEAWIPYDAYLKYCDKDRGEKHLCDDEVALLLTGIRKNVGASGNIVVIVDACHSGGATRSIDDTLCVRSARDNFVIPAKKVAKTKQAKEQWLTLSACKYYQYNYELPNGYGRLTYAICSMWKQLQNASNTEVVDAMVKYMQRPDLATALPQTPVMTGDIKSQSFKKAIRP